MSINYCFGFETSALCRHFIVDLFQEDNSFQASDITSDITFAGNITTYKIHLSKATGKPYLTNNISGDITMEKSLVSKTLQAIFRSYKKEQGSSLIEVSLVLPLLLLLIVGVLDLGRMLYYSNTLTNAANASAVYGSQDPSDITGMENTVETDASQVPGVTANASYGCECQDGSGKSTDCDARPVCSDGDIYYVTVTASAQYKPLVHWPGVPSTLTLSSTSIMRGGE